MCNPLSLGCGLSCLSKLYQNNIVPQTNRCCVGFLLNTIYVYIMVLSHMKFLINPDIFQKCSCVANVAVTQRPIYGDCLLVTMNNGVVKYLKTVCLNVHVYGWALY